MVKDQNPHIIKLTDTFRSYWQAKKALEVSWRAWCSQLQLITAVGAGERRGRGLYSPGGAGGSPLQLRGVGARGQLQGPSGVPPQSMLSV